MALYAFDGTWNQERSMGEYGKNTNVPRYRNCYLGDTNFYTKGVGTKLGLFGRIFGGAFGVGGRHRIEAAYQKLCENYSAGETPIDIIGFSRGAALALHFANTVIKRGIRKPGSSAVLEPKPKIRFLGLWDLVASFGIPIDLGIPFQRINLGYRLKLPKAVQFCCHAIALDERRQTFRVTRVDGGHEVWFRGVHSDVGGGNENLGLNNISLRWMLRKAIAAGLPIDPSRADSEAATINPDADIKEPTDIIKGRLRTFKPKDRFHYTVKARTGSRFNNPPSGSVSESEQDELRAP